MIIDLFGSLIIAVFGIVLILAVCSGINRGDDHD